MAKIDRTVGWLAEKARSDDTPRSKATGDPVSFESAFPDAVPDRSGCLLIDRLVSLAPPDLQDDATECALLAELRLVYGVGERYRQQLNDEGYASIADLIDHPRWGNASSALLANWGTPLDPGAVHRSLARWLPSSDPLTLRSIGLLPIAGFRFFDLETLGLGGSPIFLAAIGRFVENGFLIRQILAPTLAAEVALLEHIEADLADASALLTYNGKSFDWTILRERSAYYGLPLPEAPVHVDLLHHARRAFGGSLSDCHLGTIETHVLGIERTNDVPSAEVPIRYTEYLETGDAAPLIPVVNHNRQDLVSLVALLHHLLRMAADA
jgi:uncharacterized protein YprB with RNaseH-like and TPR domain